jgi:hypothetical protein
VHAAASWLPWVELMSWCSVVVDSRVVVLVWRGGRCCCWHACAGRKRHPAGNRAGVCSQLCLHPWLPLQLCQSVAEAWATYSLALQQQQYDSDTLHTLAVHIHILLLLPGFDTLVGRCCCPSLVWLLLLSEE